MIKVFKSGTLFPVPGNKRIEEFIGVRSSQCETCSIAHMLMPAGWTEMLHKTAYHEYVIVLRGELTLLEAAEKHVVPHDSVGWIEPSPFVAFCNEGPEPCEYWAICLPAYQPLLAGQPHA